MVKFDGRTLRAGRDYTLSFSFNRDAGSATITVKAEARSATLQASWPQEQEVGAVEGATA